MWEGHLLTFEGEVPVDWPQEVTIRLSNGNEGQALVASDRITSDKQGARQAASIVGNGPSPV
jgi:hypothetical protein